MVNEVVKAMKDSFIQIKSIKTNLLKNYVNNCAVKIQKIFKGYFARKFIVKIKRAFKGIDEKLVAAVLGWKIRKIMRTKEI